MIFREITLAEVNPRLPKPQTPCHIYAYLHEACPDLGPKDDKSRPAVIVVPGGAYFFTSDREADPIALKFLAEGYHVFVLRYSVMPDRYPTSLLQLAGLIAHIRQNAAAYHVRPDAIAVCGFSAGGHLSASSGILWNEPVIAETLGIENRMARPDAMILSYPVITSGEFAHRYSFECLLGENYTDEALRGSVSLENRVDDTTPPAFLWHTFADELVPLENSLLLAGALRRAGVPFELHVFPEGIHGLSLANELTQTDGNPAQIVPGAQQWMDLCLNWLNRQFR